MYCKVEPSWVSCNNLLLASCWDGSVDPSLDAKQRLAADLGNVVKHSHSIFMLTNVLDSTMLRTASRPLALQICTSPHQHFLTSFTGSLSNGVCDNPCAQNLSDKGPWWNPQRSAPMEDWYQGLWTCAHACHSHTSAAWGWVRKVHFAAQSWACGGSHAAHVHAAGCGVWQQHPHDHSFASRNFSLAGTNHKCLGSLLWWFRCHHGRSWPPCRGGCSTQGSGQGCACCTHLHCSEASRPLSNSCFLCVSEPHHSWAAFVVHISTSQCRPFEYYLAGSKKFMVLPSVLKRGCPAP